MKRSTRQSVDVLGTLLGERRKYEQWIEALEAKRDATPKHVYERVHGDYTSRLQHVMEELEARSSEIETQRKELSARVQELEADEKSKREERAEAELRNTVGEYDKDQWAQLVRDSDLALTKVSAERARVAAELESLERILASMDEEEEDAKTPTPPALPTVEEPAAAAPASREEAPAKAAATGTAAKKGEAFDELAFLKSVVPDADKDRPRSGEAARVPDGPRKTPAATKSVDAKTEGGKGPLKEGPSAGQKTGSAAPLKEGPSAVTEKSAATASSSATDDAAAGTATAAPARPRREGEADEGGGIPLRSSRVISQSEVGTAGIENLQEKNEKKGKEPPAFLKNVPQEAQKTLKCGECSAMNYATEWYCERCGAELAAL